MDTRLSVLALVASAIAIAMGLLDLASWLEAVSFVTGAICVWLTVKESIWNFPIGLLNVATFSVVFYQSRLFADAGLQVVYFALGLIGWWLWLYGGEQRTELTVGRATPLELALLAAATLGITLAIWQSLYGLSGGTAFWDAFTTALSLASQWLLNRKRLENWIGWIFVDAIYVPLYVYKHLYLTAVLYAVFLTMATMGLRAWYRKWSNAELVEVAPQAV